MLVYISFWIGMKINVILNTLNLVLFRLFPVPVLFKNVDIFCSFMKMLLLRSWFAQNEL